MSAQARAQQQFDDPVWVVGNNYVDLSNGVTGVQVTPIPICDDPLIPDAYEYQGQTAEYSQNVQCDDQGQPLFIVVDGNIFNNEGLLIADNVDGVNGQACRVCHYKGSTQVAIIPVPGSCTRFYVVSSYVWPTGVQPESYMRVGVLDLTLPSDMPGYAGLQRVVRGRFLNLLDYSQEDFNFIGSDLDFEFVDGSELDDYLFEANFGYGAEFDVVRFDVAQLEGSLGYLMTWSTGNRFRFFHFTSEGVEMVLELNKALNETADWRDFDRYFRGELESKIVGQTLRVAYTEHYVDYIEDLPAHQDAVKCWAFDISGLSDPEPSMSLIYDPPNWPRLYEPATVLFSDVQFDQNGSPIVEPAVGGLEFSPNGRYVYLAKSTNLLDTYQPEQPRSNLWAIDLNEPPGGDWYTAIDLGDVPSSVRIVDTQLGYAADVDAEESAIVAIGRDTGGDHWLGLCYDPDNPDPSNWTVLPATFEDPALRNDPNSAVEYRLLNNRIDGNTHRQFMASALCCEDLVLAKDRSRTIPTGTHEWALQSNPFGCGGEGPVFFATELRLESGAHVEAEGLTFRFGPNASLVIEPGASFECDGCVLTSACSERWAGINVQGDADQNQSLGGHPVYQGHLVLRSSLVENAITGAKAGDVGILTLNSSQPGGLIQCYSSTFKNCVRGVRFAPYANFLNTPAQPRRNRSTFSRCRFTADESWPDDLDLRAHADLWKVDGIRFNGCTFENLRNDITESHKLGMGISSLDAHYTVKRWCPTQDCDHDVVRSSFIGLDHGIHARTSGKARAFEVEYSDFTNNICGVLTEGVIGARIVNNEIVLGNRPGVMLTGVLDEKFLDQHRGIYTLSSYGFNIDDNHLVEVDPASNSTEGIVIGYSRGHNDLVFRNSCEGIDDAYVGEGICADPEQKPIVGLQFICNENHNNGYNIWNRLINDPAIQSEWADHTIRTVQGWDDQPAGNTFDRDDISLPEESDLHTNSLLNVTNYLYWGEGSESEPVDVDAVFFPPHLAASLPPDHCQTKYPHVFGDPNDDDADGMLADLDAEKLAYGNTRYQYDQLLDGGSTDEVVLEIMSSWPSEAWALRAYLLSKSPFLSVEALKEMVNKNSMPQAMQIEVMVANPDATRSDGFIQWVRDHAPVTFPEYMLAQVMASWDASTFRGSLERQMAGKHANMSQAANALIQFYSRDTVGESVDSLRWVWKQIRTPAARYAEAITYMAQGDHMAAAGIVEGIPEEHDLRTPQMLERQRMLDLITLMNTVKEDGRTDAELTAQEQDDLEALISEAHDRPAVWAQNLLCYAYDRCRSWPTGGDGTDWRAMVLVEPRLPLKFDRLTTRPNPAETWVSIDYHLDARSTDARIEVVDAMGRVIWQSACPQAEGQLVADTRTWGAATYAVRLTVGGTTLAAELLQVKP